MHGIDGSTVVGSFTSGPNNLSSGFFENGGNFTTINDPLGVDGTVATAISGNTIVGYYFDSASVAHGFVDTGGAFTTVDDPADTTGTGTIIEGIDGSTLVGYYGGLNSLSKQGFVATTAVPEPGCLATLALTAAGLLARRPRSGAHIS